MRLRVFLIFASVFLITVTNDNAALDAFYAVVLMINSMAYGGRNERFVSSISPPNEQRLP